MKQKEPVSVLVAPLDWGLGHATRCIPIINELIQQGALVVIAASSGQKRLLIQEFPNQKFLEIPGYNIRYKRGILLKWALFFRIPSLLKQIRRENKWLEETVQKCKIDAVISDNRYGLFHKNLFCVFITHQLYIQTGMGSWKIADRWTNRKILKWNYKFIGKFSSCWVPDQEGNFSVAGKLSHPPKLPEIQVKYIGILSRFKEKEKKNLGDSLLILLSGPEPQRTRFENILFSQLPCMHMQTVVVRGLPGVNHSIPFIREGIKIFNHLPANELNELVNESKYIIARSGYSTIMDLLKVKKNAILVPTPGQPEQEYLAKYFHGKKWMYCVRQKNFNLQAAFDAFKKTELELPEIPDSPLHEVVADFLRRII